MPTSSSRTIRSVQISCQIINLLREQGGAGITEISNKLEIAKSAVHNHLATLKKENFVVKEGNTYRLSLKYLDFAEHVRNQVVEHDIVKNEVDNLAVQTSEVVHFGTEERGYIIYLSKSQGKSAVETVSGIGKRMPVHSTALGKAILAEFPPNRVDQIITERGMSKQTDSTITDRDELHKELETIRNQGYAIDNEENIKGIRCLAMAVTGPDNNVIGALSVSGPSKRMTDERLEGELSDTVAQAANVIEVNSMYS